VDWRFDVGTRLSGVLDQLTETVCDVWVTPDFVLHAANERGTDQSYQQAGIQPVVFTRGLNVIGAETDIAADLVNALLMKTADGWAEANDAGDSVAKFHRREDFLSITDAPANGLARLTAQSVFDRQAQPRSTPTLEIVGGGEHEPWTDFGVGDWVRAPSDEDPSVLDRRRVVSISVSEGEAGDVRYTCEIDTIADLAEQRMERWLQAAAAGTLGGGTSMASSGGFGGAAAAGGGGGVTTGGGGPIGPRGPAGVNPRGVWAVDTAYEKYDAVGYGGATWWALADNTGVAPGTDPLVWTLLAAAGTDGDDGATAYELAAAGGFVGTQAEWLASLEGSSAFDVAVENGFVGTVGQWLTSLKGLRFTGAWSSARAYVVDEVATVFGSSYVAIQAGTNQRPDLSPTFWSVVAAKGDPGAMTARADAVYTTASLAPGGTENGTIAMSAGYRLLRIATSRPARVRLYGTAAKRTADATRPVGTDPLGDHGLMFEYVTVPGALAAGLSPLVDGVSLEVPASAAIPIAVENRDTLAGVVTVTLTWQRTE
jgi:hypothetical protein